MLKGIPSGKQQVCKRGREIKSQRQGQLKREANNKEMWERLTGDKLLERKKGQGSSRRDDGRREKK